MPERSRSDTNRYVWSRSVPDPGQLVEIRRRQWVVDYARSDREIRREREKMTERRIK